MVGVVQLVRAPDCDSGCCRFESGHPPEKRPKQLGLFFYAKKKETLEFPFLILKAFSYL